MTTADISLINFARYFEIPSMQGLLGRLNFNATLCKLRSLMKFFFVLSKCVTLLHWILVIFSLLENYVLIALVVQGNTNFQGILDWILQIYHYYCRKQHKFIKNSWIIEQNLVLCLPFFLFTANCASWRLPHRQSFFISWTQSSANFKRL